MLSSSFANGVGVGKVGLEAVLVGVMEEEWEGGQVVKADSEAAVAVVRAKDLVVVRGAVEVDQEAD